MTCHDLGRHLGCYGAPTVQSPHLDALAAAGVRFDRAFTTSPGCSPARAALATGRYPHSNGVMGLTHPPFDWDLAPGERHIAALLASAGYETHLFGFQHVSPRVDRLGFHAVHGYDRLLSCHEPAWGHNVAARFTECITAAQPEKPLYLEVNLEEPHRPYDQGGARPDRSRGVSIPGYLPADQQSAHEMAMLQGAIRQADEGVSAILDAIDRAGLTATTLAVFIADHGLAMPRAKCTLYDPGIEVALLVRWPAGGLTGGRVVDDMVSNVDILPTLLEIAGIPVPDTIHGRSILPLLRGGPSIARTAIYAEKTFHSYYDPMRAVRTERFKYIRNFETTFAVEVPADVQQGDIFRAHVELYHGRQRVPVELYDLGADPLEQRNLAGHDEFTEVERWLDGRLWSWMERTADPLLQGPIPSPAYQRTLDLMPARSNRIGHSCPEGQ
jgi:N-sulfoglucosamine sulfohydrolase